MNKRRPTGKTTICKKCDVDGKITKSSSLSLGLF